MAEGLLEKERPAELGEGVTPQEQEQYELAVALGTRILYEKGGKDRALNALKTSRGGIIMAAGKLAHDTIVMIDQKLDLPETVIIPAGAEIAEEIVDLASKARLMKADSDTAESVVAAMTAMLFDTYDVSPEDVEQDAPEVVAASQQSRATPPEAEPELPVEELPPEEPEMMEETNGNP